jgi:protease-4
MGDVAGSGGYFVAMAADKIVAQPGTITGSIGVLAGKMLTNGFWEKVGVSWDDAYTSENALVWTSQHDYTPAQWTQFQADELGGFSVALQLAKTAAGIKADEKVQLEVFPKQKTSLRQVLMQRLFADDDDESEDDMPTAVLVQSVQKLQPLFQLARKLGLDPTADVLSMPEVEPLQ